MSDARAWRPPVHQMQKFLTYVIRTERVYGLIMETSLL